MSYLGTTVLVVLVGFVSFVAGSLLTMRGITETTTIRADGEIRGTIKGNFISSEQAREAARSACSQVLKREMKDPITITMSHAIMVTTIYAFKCPDPEKDNQ